MNEYELAQYRLRYEHPPLPSLRTLIQWRNAGVLDVRRLYSAETVFLLADMTLPAIEEYLRRAR